MDKPRILPADPVEVANLPIEGVDVPETNSEAAASQNEGDDIPARKPHEKKGYVENEGLTDRKVTDPSSVESVEGEELGAAAEAAQRGRTA